jgi:hypothetical protein
VIRPEQFLESNLARSGAVDAVMDIAAGTGIDELVNLEIICREHELCPGQTMDPICVDTGVVLR